MRRIVFVAIVFLSMVFLSIGTAWAQNGGSEIVIPPAPPLTPEVSPAPAPMQPPLQQPPPGLVRAEPPQPVPPGGADGGEMSAQQPPNSLPPSSPPSQTPLNATPSNPPGNPPPGSTATLPPPDVAPAQPNNWTPGTTAVVGVLNKVDGSTTQLSLPVGAQAQTSGDLSVSVQACLSRPAGQIPDTAVFMTVSPTQGGAAPLYHGWMLRSAPGATFVGNAGQTFRVIGCS